MRTLSFGLVALVSAAGCYAQYTSPAAPVSYGWSVQQPQTVQGPPGGEMDAEGAATADQAPGMPGYPQGYPDGYGDGSGYAPDSTAQPAGPAPAEGGDVADPSATAPVTDTEIDATLAPYGSWTEDPDYGRVWRPNATVVGVDFTPYETCGSWVYTGYGWTYSCDWDWGWLPFHYGQWEYFDYGWGWVPGYEWSPAWVDWRSGGGYTGWRPTRPRIRDHRGGYDRDHGRPVVRDHRSAHRDMDSHWRFARNEDLGRPHIRSHVYANTAEGLRATQVVSKPTHVGTVTNASGVIRHPRVATGGTYYGPSPRPQAPASRNPTYTQPSRPTYTQPSRPTYTQPTYAQPSRPTYTQPSRPYTQPTYTQPSRTYTQPSRPTYTQPTYTQPSRTYTQPSRTYTQPSRPTYTQPSRTYTQPSRSSSPSYSGSRSYSAPSHSSSSYSAPSHSSSSSGSSHSSSSSSHSSSSSSHSSSSGHSGGGHHK